MRKLALALAAVGLSFACSPAFAASDAPPAAHGAAPQVCRDERGEPIKCAPPKPAASSKPCRDAKTGRSIPCSTDLSWSGGVGDPMNKQNKPKP